MKKEKTPVFHYWPLFTITGLFLFIVLYFIAAQYYPGGSNFDRKQPNFNWTSNYWCELLGRNAKNGQHNTARPVGISAMIILTISVSIFWWNLPKLIPMKKWMNQSLQFSGVLAMVLSSFIFSHYHDIFIYLSVLFGTIALIITLFGLYSNSLYRYFILCIICIILILLNNIIYLTDFMITSLPILQKFTFAFIFLWIGLLSLRYLKDEFK
jgi:hypothetical protein